MGGLSFIEDFVKDPVGSLEDAGDSLISFGDDLAEDLGLTSEGQKEAIKEGQKKQETAALSAIGEQRAAREASQDLLSPFVGAGLFALPGLAQGLGEIQAPGTAGQDFLNTALLAGGVPDDLSGAAKAITALGLGGAQELEGQALQLTGEDQSQIDLASSLGGQVLDPTTGINPAFASSPQFQALQEEATRNLEQSAAARGRVGAGGTKEAIARQSLLLGNQFQQQDLQNRLQAQGQSFGQFGQAVGTQLGAGQQQFQNQLAANQTRFGQQGQVLGSQLGVLNQGFANLGGAQQQNFANTTGLNAQLFNQITNTGQTDFSNRLAGQGQNVGQLLNLLGIGQASAAGVGAQGIQTAGNIGNLLTGIGNSQAAGGIGIANADAQAGQNILSTLLTLGGSFGQPTQPTPTPGVV